MKKVLIVVPGCGTGGILTSLIALLNSTFVNRYSVNIFIMNGYGEFLIQVNQCLGPFCNLLVIVVCLKSGKPNVLAI